MTTYQRVERTEAFQMASAARDHGFFDPSDGTHIPFTGVDFCRLYSKRPVRPPSVHLRLACGWTAKYWLREVIQKDDIPF